MRTEVNKHFVAPLPCLTAPSSLLAFLTRGSEKARSEPKSRVQCTAGINNSKFQRKTLDCWGDAILRGNALMFVNGNAAQDTLRISIPCDPVLHDNRTLCGFSGGCGAKKLAAQSTSKRGPLPRQNLRSTLRGLQRMPKRTMTAMRVGRDGTAAHRKGQRGRFGASAFVSVTASFVANSTPVVEQQSPRARHPTC